MRYALVAGVAASAAALSCWPLAAARAAPILYTETTTASGTLGGTSFKDRPLTVAYLGDTNNIISPGPFVQQEPGGVAGFYLSGIAAGVFNGGTAAALLFPSQSAFGIGGTSTNPNLVPPGTNGPGGSTAQGLILGLNNPAFASYNLATSLGPITGPGVLQSDPAAGGNGTPATFSTTSGDLTLTKVGTVTFTATQVTANK